MVIISLITGTPLVWFVASLSACSSVTAFRGTLPPLLSTPPPGSRTCAALLLRVLARPRQASLWLAAHLTSAACEGMALLVVSHDRAFLDRVAQETVLLKDRQLRCVLGVVLAAFWRCRACAHTTAVCAIGAYGCRTQPSSPLTCRVRALARARQLLERQLQRICGGAPQRVCGQVQAHRRNGEAAQARGGVDPGAEPEGAAVRRRQAAQAGGEVRGARCRRRLGARLARDGMLESPRAGSRAHRQTAHHTATCLDQSPQKA